MNHFIPVNTPLLGGNEGKYLQECIETGWISSEGKFVSDFENELANRVDRKYGVAVANGTAALEVACAALGISEGDEVIMPTQTIISCPGAVIRNGGKPVLIDVSLDTWQMKVDQIEEKINERTKAIMMVHLYGLPADVDPILELTKKYNLKLIEDCSQMLGQTYKGKACGSFGDISTFSFYPNKQITTGEGGMCVMNDPELYESVKSYKNLCFQPERRFYHKHLGWNYRMTNLQGALGLAQIEKLDKHVIRKREIGNRYNDNLKGCEEFIQLPVKSLPYSENIYWVYGLVLKESAKMNALEFMSILGENNIGTRPFYYSIHEQPVFKEMGLFNGESYPNSEYLEEYAFYIPSGLGVENNEIDYVSSKIKEILYQ